MNGVARNKSEYFAIKNGDKEVKCDWLQDKLKYNDFCSPSGTNGMKNLMIVTETRKTGKNILKRKFWNSWHVIAAEDDDPDNTSHRHFLHP